MATFRSWSKTLWWISVLLGWKASTGTSNITITHERWSKVCSPLLLCTHFALLVFNFLMSQRRPKCAGLCWQYVSLTQLFLASSSHLLHYFVLCNTSLHGVNKIFVFKDIYKATVVFVLHTHRVDVFAFSKWRCILFADIDHAGSEFVSFQGSFYLWFASYFKFF